MLNPRERLQAARLYLVCDAQPNEFLHATLRGGVEIVQLRVKESSDAAILSSTRRFARVSAAYGALFILNDRPELVAEAEADGVHVGQDDVPVEQARALVGPERIVGLSTHSRAQIDAAGQTDVDYIAVGPVHETPTKPGRPAVGLELVHYAAQRAERPFFAIGGITTGNVASAVAAGAVRIAVVRALTESSDPEQTARDLRAELDDHQPPGEVGVGSA